MMKLMISILAIHSTVICNSEVTTCEPCEENKICRIYYVHTPIDMMPAHYIWRNCGTDISICYPNIKTECIVLKKFDVFRNSTIQSNPGSITTDVMFLADRQSKFAAESKWELSVFNSDESILTLYSCYINIYKKITDAWCTFKTSHSGIEFKCISTMLYPENACKFLIRFNKKIILNSQAKFYNHTVVAKNPIYFTTECSLFLPVELLADGLLEYQATMQPNISYDCKQRMNCYNEVVANGIINIEHPHVVLENCSNAIEEGKVIHCTCRRKDKSDISTHVYWFSNFDTPGNYENSSILTEIAIRNKTVFYCKGRNELGWIDSQEYNPRITTSENSSNNEVTCSSEKPYTCSSHCYGNTEFCFNDNVYSCQQIQKEKYLREWCISVNDMKLQNFSLCHKLCVTDEDKATANDYQNIIIYIIIIGVLAFAGFLVILFIRYKTNHNRMGDQNFYSRIFLCGKTSPRRVIMTEDLGNSQAIAEQGSLVSLESDPPESESDVQPQEECFSKFAQERNAFSSQLLDELEDPSDINLDSNYESSSSITPSIATKSGDNLSLDTINIHFYQMKLRTGVYILRKTDISKNKKIRQLKHDLTNVHTVSESNQLWYYKGILLDDDKSLNEIGITSGDSIEVRDQQHRSICIN